MWHFFYYFWSSAVIKRFDFSQLFWRDFARWILKCFCFGPCSSRNWARAVWSLADYDATNHHHERWAKICQLKLLYLSLYVFVCIFIFLDPAYCISYSDPFCHLFLKNISHHRCLRFSLYLSLLLLCGTGSVYCGTEWYLAVLVASVICFRKICGLHGVNHQIFNIQRRKKWWRRDKSTDRITYIRLDP